jgi:DNA helicase HerA-like ATPase
MLSPPKDPNRTMDFLLSGCQLVEFGAWFDPDEVNAAFALVFSMMYEHRLSEYEDAIRAGMEPPIRVAVLDEAHRIVPAEHAGGDERLLSAGKETTELFCHMIAECRALGQGLIVAEQSTARIDPNVLVNTSTKLVHCTLYGRDKDMLGSALSLSEDERNYLSYLRPGEALACLPEVYSPVALRVPRRIGATTVADMALD